MGAMQNLVHERPLQGSATAESLAILLRREEKEEGQYGIGGGNGDRHGPSINYIMHVHVCMLELILKMYPFIN